MARAPGFASRLALAAIRGYQRHLSPHKGFSCAYRCATGRHSCSAHGYRVIERFGLWRGLVLLQRRLHLCGEVHRSRVRVPNPILHGQRGECDCGCDPSCLPDMGDLCECDCDCSRKDCRDLRNWWRRRREKRRLQRLQRQRDHQR